MREINIRRRKIRLKIFQLLLRRERQNSHCTKQQPTQFLPAHYTISFLMNLFQQSGRENAPAFSRVKGRVPLSRSSGETLVVRSTKSLIPSSPLLQSLSVFIHPNPIPFHFPFCIFFCDYKSRYQILLTKLLLYGFGSLNIPSFPVWT